MWMSICTILLFIAGIIGIMFYPKTENRMNGMKLAVMGTMAVFCYLSFCAFVYNKAGIAIGLPSACASLIVMNLFLWGVIVYKRRVQRLFWRVSDIVCLLLLAVFMVWIAMHVFTPELKLQYNNVDAASHFSYANQIVYTGKLNSLTYFSAFVDALFIQLFAPVLTPVLYYKAFIIADIFMHILEMWMFYYLILTISDRKIVRILAPVFTLGYFWGYPAYSFMEGHFVYWSNGVMIYMLILYALLLIEKYRPLLRYSIPLLLLGLYANTCCNKLFVPTNTLAVAAVVAVLLGQKYWKKIDKKRFGIVAGIGVLLLAGAAGCYLYVWRGAFSTLLEDLSAPGGMYSALFADLIFFLPAWIYVFWCVIKKRYTQRTVPVTCLCMACITIGMYCLMRMGYMSLYYYYKIYYNVWLSCWLLAAVALELMAEKKQLAWYFSYLGMAALIAWITLSDYDTKIAEVHEDYRSWNATTQMFSIYNYNADLLRTDYEAYQISDQVLDVYNYAMNELADMDVRIVTDQHKVRVWHDGIDLVHTRGVYFEEFELTELLWALDDNNVQAIIVDRSEEKYQIYSGYFDRCRVIYSNGDSAILVPEGERWFEIPQDAYTASDAKMELYSYVAQDLAGQFVPLLAEQGAYFDYIFYYMVTGNCSQGFYPWQQVTEEDVDLLSQEEAMQLLAERNLENLRESGVTYMLLLKDDAFCQQTGAYYDGMPVVYENDAGKVIALNTEDES